MTPTVTRTFIPLFTSLVNRQTTQRVNTQGGRRIEGEIWGRGGTETRCKQRIRRRKGIINNMNLKSLKKGEKCSAECKGRHLPFSPQMRWGPPLPRFPQYIRIEVFLGFLQTGNLGMHYLVVVRYLSHIQIVLSIYYPGYISVRLDISFSAYIGIKEKDRGGWLPTTRPAAGLCYEGLTRQKMLPESGFCIVGVEPRADSPAMLAIFHGVCCLA